MSAKPLTSQSCNSHSCSVTRCNTSNCYLHYNFYYAMGGACDKYRNENVNYIVWDGRTVASNFGGSSVSAGGYTYTQGSQFDYSQVEDSGGYGCFGYKTNTYYCVTRS